MQFGIIVPNWAPYDTKLMIDVAVEAEQLGYEYVFYTDHLINPYSYKMDLPNLSTETWTLIAHVAAKTSRIRLATAVTPIPLRPPPQLAKMVATVDELSNGRVTLGVGTGWVSPDFDGYGTEFGTPATRKARMREGIELMRRMWTEDEVTFEGEFYRVENAVLDPKPVQKPHVPLCIGGWRQHMLEYTAEVGDAWLPWNRPVDFYGQCVKEIKRLLEERGDDRKILFGAGVLVLDDKLRNERFPLVHGDPPNLTIGTVKPSIEEYRQAGADLFTMMIFPGSDALSSMRQFAKEVMPDFK